MGLRCKRAGLRPLAGCGFRASIALPVASGRGCVRHEGCMLCSGCSTCPKSPRTRDPSCADGHRRHRSQADRYPNPRPGFSWVSRSALLAREPHRCEGLRVRAGDRTVAPRCSGAWGDL